MSFSSWSLCLKKHGSIKVEGRWPLLLYTVSGEVRLMSFTSRELFLTLGLWFRNRNRQFSPASFSLLMFAPYLSSRSTSSLFPMLHASCKGVIPALFSALGSAPCSSSSEMQLTSSFRVLVVFIAIATAARCRGVFPECCTLWEKPGK